MLTLLAENSIKEQRYDNAVRLLMQAQDLGPFAQDPELRTISLVRHLLQIHHAADVIGRFLAGTSIVLDVKFNKKSVKPCLHLVACVRS